MVWSEFGRTIRVNGSSGTDHGHSQDCLILGGKIKREVFGPEPTLAETINKNVYTPQVSFTSLLKHLYQSGGIPDDVVNQVLSESFPGSQEFNLFV